MFYVHDGQRGMNAGMRLSVADQARLLRERLAANITDIRSFARVDKQMLPVRGATCESLAAYVTVVRPVAGVGHHVLFQPMVLRERFPALLADEALPSLVLQQNVLVEILLCDHAPLADLALVLRLEVRPLLMYVQRVAVRASFPAHVAHDRPLLVLESHVQPHVTLHLELLAAVLAVVLVLGRVFPLQVFLQSPPVLALELAHVARILLGLRSRCRRVPVATPPSAHTFARVFPADVRVKRRLVRALVVAKVARVRQAIGVLRLLVLLLGLVLQSDVHLESDQTAAYLEADLALVTLGLLVDGVSVPFQHLHHRKADVALLAGVYFRVVVHVVLVVVDLFLLHLHGTVIVACLAVARDHKYLFRVIVCR